ncbi:3-oxoacyl-[acyl-carrier-protein] reductase [Thermosediminibacter litoriperuensis]|uniref:3-oxoacyl-[acyl-carrier-protein] reductase n=1 Tax=Thermosediminibacter litoriperuensis TaxID=291989 RepID=A0A5S5AZP8_9FIRM|nr:3-oxoacyl-[acyl-carrier-protein] reductase [Thermosediminibacter litoriperuensis]TYP59969.1 3-oxoacyl-[acyl-carrier-protein] reductase [Thermosediminibacter litoriperuensis]
MDLSGKACIVTGGSRGIGRSISIKLARSGAVVVVNYKTNEKSALEVVAEIESLGGTAMAYRADVADYNQAAKMVEDVYQKYGRIDVLVNNAGITRDALILRMTEKDWDDVINTNLKGLYNTTKSVVKYMVKQRGGKIINISSVAGIYGNAGQANYAAAKAGIIGFTKALAKELGSRGITVNAVAPGFIKTDMTSAMIQKTSEDVIAEKIALKRLGEPEDVANLVAFLASDESSYITGQIIAIDGGLTL